MKRITTLTLALAVVVLSDPGRAVSQTPVGTAFTYQGDLSQSGSPFERLCVGSR